MYEVVVYAIYRETRRDLQRMAPTVVTILFLVALGECIAVMSPLFSVCYSESVSFLVASAVPIFQSTPSDQTVVEGGDVTFSCDATLNGVRRLLSYRIRNGSGALLRSVRLNITDLSTVNGVVGGCVLGEFNSQLVLKGVTREANGYTVTCSILNEDETTFTDQTQPPATMSVICTLLGIQSLSMRKPFHKCNQVPASAPFMQTLLYTASSQTNPLPCWKRETSLTPLGLKLNQLPPTSPGPEMARSSPVMVG